MTHQTRLAAIFGALILAGCASTPEGSRVDYDPWEPLNRNLYVVNDVADKGLLKPAAQGHGRYHTGEDHARSRRVGGRSIVAGSMPMASASNTCWRGVGIWSTRT